MEKITVTDISIDAMTEAFATVDMPVASKKKANLRCKVDTGAGGNVMPLRAFAKLFPNWLMKTGMPTGLQKCNTKLRAYNGTNIPQLGALDTPITWKDEETKEVNKMDTTFYVANTPGPAVLGLPSCSRLRIVNLNCSVQLRKHDSKELGNSQVPTTYISKRMPYLLCTHPENAQLPYDPW